MLVKGYKIFIGSDSGYDGSFRKIGSKYGPFNIAFLECGQYGKYWPQIHMFPEQAVMAAKDLRAELVMPVHWGKFVLSTHPWNEPIKRFTTAARKEQLNFIAPKIGEPVRLDKDYPQKDWWEFENKNEDHGK